MSKNSKKIQKPRRTSVELTDIAWAIKEKHAPLIGLKEVLSAGLVMFNNATQDQQYQALLEAKKPLTEQDQLQVAKENLNKLLDNLDKSHIQILAEADCQQLAKLRQLIGPDSDPQHPDHPKAKESV